MHHPERWAAPSGGGGCGAPGPPTGRSARISRRPPTRRRWRTPRSSPGDRVLDVGCGVGSFLRLVVDRGGEPFGMDASAALIEFAHERLPDADLRDGEMEALPYEADSFDLVAGFNSFFFANDIVAALAEARRVAKPGASVVIQVWGRHECCDFEAMKSIARHVLSAASCRCAGRS